MRKEDIRLILDGLHQDPYSVLGMHAEGDEEKQIAVRAFLPEAEEAWVVHSKKGTAHPMEKVHKDGFYVAEFPRKRPFPYRLRIQTKDGKVLSFKDPYSFGRGPSLSTISIFLAKALTTGNMKNLERI